MTDADVVAILTKNPEKKAIIDAVADLGLLQAWIAGGFVRNAVWDTLFSDADSTPINDVDVVYFKPLDEYRVDTDELLARIVRNEPNLVWEEENRACEALKSLLPRYEFEVKNQARMHISSARITPHEPYKSLDDAVAGWIETATATGIRREDDGSYAVLAPFGLDDLSQGIVRPTCEENTERALERAQKKGWFTLWKAVQFQPYDEVHTRRR